MAIAGRKAQVRVAGAPLPVTAEPTTANAARTQYQITDPARRVLDMNAAVTVTTFASGSTTGVVATPGQYTINRLTGTVVFATARNSGTTVQVAASYLPLSVAAEAREYTVTLSASNQDASALGDTHVRRQQGLKDASGSISLWTTTDRYFEEALAAGSPVVLDFYSDGNAAAPDIRAWALISSDEISAAADGLAETAVEWEATADVDGRSISLV